MSEKEKSNPNPATKDSKNIQDISDESNSMQDGVDNTSGAEVYVDPADEHMNLEQIDQEETAEQEEVTEEEEPIEEQEEATEEEEPVEEQEEVAEEEDPVEEQEEVAEQEEPVEEQEELAEEEEPVEEQEELAEEEEPVEEQEELAEEEEPVEEQEEVAEEEEPVEEQEEVAEEEVDYEKIKQDLLKEYAENKTEEDQTSVEESLEDLSEEETSEEIVENTEDAEEEDNRDKINLDDDLEIEDIQESLDGDVINRPRSSNQEEQEISPDVDQGFSKVAISKGSSIAIVIGLGVFLIYVIYKILQPSEEELNAQKSTINKNLPIISPVEDMGQTIVVPDIPDFPEMPNELTPPVAKDLPTPPMPSTLELPSLSAPPPPPSISDPSISVPMAPPVNQIQPLGSAGKVNMESIDKNAAARAAADAARKKARMTSGMMVGGSGGGGNKNKNSDGQSLTILERNSDQTVATHIGDLQRVIASGKVIDAVLETAINTDLPGLIRGVVSRDVYSEAGTNILINRGSRLIGSYSSEISYGQARVQIVWSRVIRPDGIDIAVDSPGIDAIGRSGSAGEVDNHVLRNFTTAMMVSLINIGVAEYADRNGTSGSTTSTTTTNTDGSSTSTDDSTALDDAYDDAVDNISSIGTDIIEKTMDMPPTITIDQGTSLKVFVKQDLVFPGRSANLTRLVE